MGGGAGGPSPSKVHWHTPAGFPTLLLAGLQNHPRASALNCSPAWEKLPVLPQTHKTLLLHTSSYPPMLTSRPTFLIGGTQHLHLSCWPAFPFCSLPGPCIPIPPPHSVVGPPLPRTHFPLHLHSSSSTGHLPGIQRSNHQREKKMSKSAFTRVLSGNTPLTFQCGDQGYGDTVTTQGKEDHASNVQCMGGVCAQPAAYT